MSSSPAVEGLKYAPLSRRLAAEQGSEVVLGWDELEALVGPLPESAAQRQFWANARGYHNTRREAWLGPGFNAFYRPEQKAVQFVRIASGEDWSQDELRACVLAYRSLVLQAQGPAETNKSETRRGVIAASLMRRTEGSYEWRMQNISAVLDDLGLPWLAGYKPARNVGEAKPEIIRLINEIWGRDCAVEAPTSDAEKLATRAFSARQRRKKLWPSSPPPGNAAPAKAASAVSQFVRDPEVVAWVLEACDGRCEACGGEAPFSRVGGEPFLEVHHVTHLADGGPDQADNAVAVCPNCHRRLHFSSDRDAYRKAVFARVARLKRYPRSRT